MTSIGADSFAAPAAAAAGDADVLDLHGGGRLGLGWWPYIDIGRNYLGDGGR